MLNLVSVIVLVALAVSVAGATIAATQFIAEDSPFWNCYFLGNRVCGPNADHFLGFILGR
jgi:hypothetical protein